MRRLAEKLRSFLAANSGLQEVVDTRVFIAHIPQDEPCPVIWLGRRTSDDEAGTLDGVVGEEPLTETFDIEAIAEDYATAEIAIAKVRACLHHYRGTWDGVRIQGVFVRDAADDYRVRSDKSGEGFFVAAVSAEVFAGQG